jgi:hypothetical protein
MLQRCQLEISNMAMAEYEQVEPFGIDNGQLNGLALHEAFVLGVEWQMVAQQAAATEGFERPIHAANRDRLEALLTRHERRYSLHNLHDDVSENWLWLTVDPA